MNELERKAIAISKERTELNTTEWHPINNDEDQEEFSLLKSLEDLVDQLGRGKISEENVYIILDALVNFNNEEENPNEYKI